jgi:hypothetical protein
MIKGEKHEWFYEWDSGKLDSPSRISEQSYHIRSITTCGHTDPKHSLFLRRYTKHIRLASHQLRVKNNKK